MRWAQAILALHVLAVVWFLPARHATLDDPYATEDMSFYLASGLEVAAGGALTGYTASHLAGYPYGSWMSLGKRGYEAAMLWGPGGSPIRRYYLFLLTTSLLGPWVIGLAALAIGQSRGAAWGMAAAAAVAYHLADPLSSFWTYGTSAFQFSSALAVWAAALCWQPTARRAVAAGLVGALALWIHTIAVVPLLLGMVAVAGSRSPAAGRRAGAMAGALTVIALLVVPGHWHLLGQLHLRMPMRPHFMHGGLRFMVMDLLDDRAYGRPYDRRAVLHALLILATWQVLADPRGERGGLTAMWRGALFCLVLAWPAGDLPFVRELQPYRFVASAELFLIAPACFGLRRLASSVRAADRASRAALLAVGLCLLPAFTGTVLDLSQRRPLSGLAADEMAAVEWVRGFDGPGRIGCELDALGNLLPSLTGREVIGGGISRHAVLVQNWADISNDWSFGRPNAELTPGAFRAACALLDVRVLIIATPALIELVESTPAVLRERSGALRIYTLEPEPGPGIWPGCYQGRIASAPNRLTIQGAPEGRFVIHYHYDPQLRPPAGVTLAPADVPGAGAPFIEVDNQSGLRTIALVAGR